VSLLFELSMVIPMVMCRIRPGIQPKLEALRTLYEGKKIIVGRDKLDVVKGVFQKVHLFLSSHNVRY
jgi:trehalose-6-phosphate synthase